MDQSDRFELFLIPRTLRAAAKCTFLPRFFSHDALLFLNQRGEGVVFEGVNNNGRLETRVFDLATSMVKDFKRIACVDKKGIPLAVECTAEQLCKTLQQIPYDPKYSLCTGNNCHRIVDKGTQACGLGKVRRELSKSIEYKLAMRENAMMSPLQAAVENREIVKQGVSVSKSLSDVARASASMLEASAELTDACGALGEASKRVSDNCGPGITTRVTDCSFSSVTPQMDISQTSTNASVTSSKLTESTSKVLNAMSAALQQDPVGFVSEACGYAGAAYSTINVGSEVYSYWTDQQDGLHTTVNSVRHIATGVAFSAGASKGAVFGATIGTFILPGVGTTVGAVLGGIACGYTAGKATNSFAESIGNRLLE